VFPAFESDDAFICLHREFRHSVVTVPYLQKQRSVLVKEFKALELIFLKTCVVPHLYSLNPNFFIFEFDHVLLHLVYASHLRSVAVIEDKVEPLVHGVRIVNATQAQLKQHFIKLWSSSFFPFFYQIFTWPVLVERPSVVRVPFF